MRCVLVGATASANTHATHATQAHSCRSPRSAAIGLRWHDFVRPFGTGMPALVGSSLDGSIVVADTAHAQILRTASASAEAVHALAVVNQYLAAGVADGSVRVYHFETLEIVRTLRPKRTVASVGAYAAHAVLSVAFSPDGQHLAASCVDSAVRVFGWASEQSIRNRRHPNRARQLGLLGVNIVNIRLCKV